jgi:hypothetical protein
MIERTEAQKSEMRVAVAKDVIAQMTAKAYQPGSGYVFMEFKEPLPQGATDLREVLGLPTARCEVCARGALLLSKARLYNAVPLKTIRSSQHVCCGQWFTESALADVFSAETLMLVEAAYEQCYHFAANLKERYAASQFGSQYRDDTERMVAIMENIIANGGEFKP